MQLTTEDIFAYVRNPLAPFSATENLQPHMLKVYKRLGQGDSVKQMATNLNITYATGKVYASRLYTLTGRNRFQIIADYQASLKK